MPSRVPLSRVLLVTAIGGLCLALTNRNQTAAAEVQVSPSPRVAPADVDRAIRAGVKARSELMKNLEYLSDRIGGRLTGYANLEKANKWTAEKMKAYGLENVRLEPWEIPYGWERGSASMKLVEPNTGRSLLIASRGWAPGTKGKVTGDVVLLKARSKADLQAYKGKLKNAVVLLSPPANVRPITDLNYLGLTNPKKDEPKKDEPKKEELKKDEPKKEPKQDGADDFATGSWMRDEIQPGNAFVGEILAFLKEEGAACEVTDSPKPHGL